jgi:oligosaccharide 4-alpha-D-glucosyltransferase
LDIYKPEAQKWYWPKYARLWKSYGIHGWWCDSGEPENHPKRMVHSIGAAEDAHNLYPLYWAKMISDNHNGTFSNQRLFNLARSGYAGVQRYNIFPWSGDVSRSWDAMRAQTSIMLGAGTCGIGYMHSDLGGFTGGPLDEDLYTRWLQMGTFVPVMRAHGSGLPSEPVFFSAKTQKNVKEAIKLRYRLLPYNYTLTFENHAKGLPLARPLYFYYPKDEYVQAMDDEYMWGENLLIAPIFEKENLSRKVYLPKGKWFDFHSFSAWWGGGVPITVPVFEDKIPVFVKAGAFIPTSPEIMHTSQYNTDTLIINYFPDVSIPQSQYSLYNDNGETPNAFEKKMYNQIHFSGKTSLKGLNIQVQSEGSYPSMPNKRFLVWGINNISNQPKSVSINKKKYLVVSGEPSYSKEQAYYDATSKRLILYIDWDNMPLNIVLEGGMQP